MVRIHISNDSSGRIVVSFPYDPLPVARVKTIDGRRWHSAAKHCSFPKESALEKISRVFWDEEVLINPALKNAPPKVKDTPSPPAPACQ